MAAIRLGDVPFHLPVVRASTQAACPGHRDAFDRSVVASFREFGFVPRVLRPATDAVGFILRIRRSSHSAPDSIGQPYLCTPNVPAFEYRHFVRPVRSGSLIHLNHLAVSDSDPHFRCAGPRKVVATVHEEVTRGRLPPVGLAMAILLPRLCRPARGSTSHRRNGLACPRSWVRSASSGDRPMRPWAGPADLRDRRPGPWVRSANRGDRPLARSRRGCRERDRSWVRSARPGDQRPQE